jgi:alpha-mannosidase
MPVHYNFADCDGLRDTGQHRFEYSLMPSWDDLNEGNLTREGYAYNMPEPIELPFSIEGDVVVTAWKTAEDGEGWILRLQEAGGAGTEVALSFAEERSVTKTDLLERAQGEATSGETYKTAIHKHGIVTLRIR